MDLNIRSTISQEGRKLNVMIYGLPGAGKTKFIGSAAKRFKTLIASAESGLLSIRDMVDDEGKPVQADFVDVKKFSDLEGIMRFLLGKKDHGYECFAVDSGTEIQQVCMDHILMEEKRDKPQLQDWGTLNNKMVRMIRAFRDLPNMNMIMTALSEQEAQPDGTMKHVPVFQGRLQKTICGYFDQVAFAHVKTLNPGTPEEERKHFIVCQPDDKLLTKDRSGKLPKTLPNDFTEMYKRVFETPGVRT